MRTMMMGWRMLLLRLLVLSLDKVLLRRGIIKGLNSVQRWTNSRRDYGGVPGSEESQHVC
jgi:hypothetical protein